MEKNKTSVNLPVEAFIQHKMFADESALTSIMAAIIYAGNVHGIAESIEKAEKIIKQINQK